MKVSSSMNAPCIYAIYAPLVHSNGAELLLLPGELSSSPTTAVQQGAFFCFKALQLQARCHNINYHNPLYLLLTVYLLYIIYSMAFGAQNFIVLYFVYVMDKTLFQLDLPLFNYVSFVFIRSEICFQINFFLLLLFLIEMQTALEHK